MALAFKGTRKQQSRNRSLLGMGGLPTISLQIRLKCNVF